MFRRAVCLRSAFQELEVVGSRWTRFLAKSRALEADESHATTTVATPSITVIPTLHVASIKFYDRVLEYMSNAVQKNKNVVVLLEGICDSDEAAAQQRQEYRDIANNTNLRQVMLSKADENAIFPPKVIHEICLELAVNEKELNRLEATVRLQECYLKPKMAAMCGLNLRNDADMNLQDIQNLLADGLSVAKLFGDEAIPPSVAINQLGSYPIIRQHRERRVALIARSQCESWLENNISGEVIVPWGFFHTEAIKRYIIEGNSAVHEDTGGETKEKDEDASKTVDTPRDPIFFVEADELVAKIPFGITRELIEPPPDTPGENTKTAAKTEDDKSATGSDELNGQSEDSSNTEKKS